MTAENTWSAEQDVDDMDDRNAGNRPPQFTAKLRDCHISESGRCHFEARVIPQGDPHLKIEWLHEGRPLKMANRIQMHQEFGYVSLNINPAYPEDGGVYTCLASNRFGHAETSAQLVCQGKESLILGSQHADALSQIEYLEGQQVSTRFITSPRFIDCRRL